MLCACLLAAGGMGLWHTVEFFEKEKVVGEEFYQQWTSVRRSNSNWNSREINSFTVPCSYCATIPESHTTGRTLSPGLVWPRRWWPQFCSRDRRFACAANGRRRNSWICNTWCPSIRRSSPHTHMEGIPSLRCTQRPITTDPSTDPTIIEKVGGSSDDLECEKVWPFGWQAGLKWRELCCVWCWVHSDRPLCWKDAKRFVVRNYERRRGV